VTSFHFDIGSRARNAGRFIASVRNELLRALSEKKKEKKFSQQTLAHKLEVHRSLINRQLTGETNLTLRSLADLAWAMDLEISFELKKPAIEPGKNQTSATSTVQSSPIRVINGARNRGVPLAANSDRCETTDQAKLA
jgi:transcriptional regulator with XRE-family HTH domain